MASVRQLIASIREIPSKYPAVISAYIIYLYLFFVMIRFFVIAKHSAVTFLDVIEVFDALPFMWLLAVTLVKVIDVRTKLHESETRQIVYEQNLQIKETQIETMHQVVLGLQHEINNPLAIILLTIHRMKRKLLPVPEVKNDVDTIENEFLRITDALKNFSETQKYQVEMVGTTVGAMAVPEKS